MAALTLANETYHDKVWGAWTGKSIGITLGAGQRGQMAPGRANFYSPVPGQPAASVALDFPLVWLHSLEKSGPDVSSDDLAVAWLEHLDYSQDEFAYASLNLRRGLPPPACGSHSNWFRHSTGGVMRADFWALLAPGAPQVAAAYAYHDAKLDHSEDGVWAAMFLAALDSAAFFLNDPIVLLTIGLAMIPRTCRTARGVKTAMAAAHRAASWLEARESVQNEVGSKNFTDVPQNMGFYTIGLLYGMQNFGASLCAGVNCGYDSEAVGGALGATLGILNGREKLPEDWTRPIGDLVIPGLGMRDLDAPTTLTDVAARTVEQGKRVVAARCPDVAFGTPPILSHIELDDPAPAPPLAETAAPLADNFALPQPTGKAASEALPILPGSPLDRNTATAAIPLSTEADETPTVATPFTQPAVTSEEEATVQPDPTLHTGTVAGVGEGGSLDAGTEGTAQALPSTFPTLPAEVSPAPDGVAAQSSAYDTFNNLPVPSPPAAFTPQPVSETNVSFPAASEGVAHIAPVAPDPMSAIAWADSTYVKPLLVTPPNALLGQAGPFAIVMDTGDAPAIGLGVAKTLAFSITNQGEQPFSGRVTLLAPPGWQIFAPQNLGQRQYIAAHTGTLRADFTLRAEEGQARVEIANSVTLRFTPDSGGVPFEASFVLLGASCWWTTGTFANFDGEGFDRSYAPEDRPGLRETYLSRTMQQTGWQRTVFMESVLNIEALFKGSSGVAYGQTILRSPVAREARLVASTNSGVKLWLNGALALRRFHRETFRPVLGSGPWAVDVSLRAGDNPVLVKWVRGSEPIEFSLTVADRFGRGLPDIGNMTW